MTNTRDMDGNELRTKLIGEVGMWGQCADYPRSDWAYEVGNNDTQLGYWDWVIDKHDLDSTVTDVAEQSASEQAVRDTINAAANDILEAAGYPDSGITDAINLLVNVTLHRLFEDADATLATVVAASYDDPHETVTIADVVQWMQD